MFCSLWQANCVGVYDTDMETWCLGVGLRFDWVKYFVGDDGLEFVVRWVHVVGLFGVYLFFYTD